MYRRSLAVASCLLLLGLAAPRARGQEEAVPGDLTGTWTGEFIYANGLRGTVDVTLAPSGPSLYAGPFEMRVADEEAVSRRGGTLELRVEGDRIVEVAIVPARGGGRFVYRVSGDVRPADPYAESACYGTFEGQAQAAPERGVFILWRFRG